MEFLLQPLTLLTFFPLLGVLVLLFIPSDNKPALRWTALGTTLVTFVISLWVLTKFVASDVNLQLVAQYDWITVAGWNITPLEGVSIQSTTTVNGTPVSLPGGALQPEGGPTESFLQERAAALGLHLLAGVAEVPPRGEIRATGSRDWRNAGIFPSPASCPRENPPSTGSLKACPSGSKRPCVSSCPPWRRPTAP